jgi:hypothetical protein
MAFTSLAIVGLNIHAYSSVTLVVNLLYSEALMLMVAAERSTFNVNLRHYAYMVLRDPTAIFP